MVAEEGMAWTQMIILFLIGFALIMLFAPRLIGTITKITAP